MEFTNKIIAFAMQGSMAHFIVFKMCLYNLSIYQFYKKCEVFNSVILH